jgi:hypothetical protein
MTPRQRPCRHAASRPPASGARYPAAACTTICWLRHRQRRPPPAGRLLRCYPMPCAEDSEDRPPAPRPRSSGRLGGRQRSVPADGQPSDRRPNRQPIAAGGCRGPTASYGTPCVRRCPSLDAPEPPLCAAGWPVGNTVGAAPNRQVLRALMAKQRIVRTLRHLGADALARWRWGCSLAGAPGWRWVPSEGRIGVCGPRVRRDRRVAWPVAGSVRVRMGGRGHRPV